MAKSCGTGGIGNHDRCLSPQLWTRTKLRTEVNHACFCLPFSGHSTLKHQQLPEVQQTDWRSRTSLRLAGQATIALHTELP